MLTLKWNGPSSQKAKRDISLAFIKESEIALI